MNGNDISKTLTFSFALSLAVSASVALSPAFSATQGYSDVKRHWAQDEIQKMADRKVMPGFNDGMFHPNAWVTRSEFSQMTAGALGLESQQADSIPVLQDVNRNAWQFQPVQDQAVLSAYPQGVFQPENPLRRVEALAAMAGVLNKPMLKTEEADRVLSRYADAEQIPGELRQAIATAIQYKLFAIDPKTPSGEKREGKLIEPLRPITRAETAVILNNLSEHRDISIVKNGRVIASAATTIQTTGQQATSSGVTGTEATGQTPLVGTQSGESTSQPGMTSQGLNTQGGTTSQQGMTSQGLNSQGGTTSQQGVASQGLNTQGGTTSQQGVASQGLNTQGGTTSQQGVASQGIATPNPGQSLTPGAVTTPPETGASSSGSQSTGTPVGGQNPTSLGSAQPSGESSAQNLTTSPGSSAAVLPSGGTVSSSASGQGIEAQSGQASLANAQPQPSAPQGITTMKTQGTSMVRGSETGETGEAGKTTTQETSPSASPHATEGLAPTAAKIDFYQGYGTPYRNSADTIPEFRTVNATTTPATMDAAILQSNAIPINVTFTGTVAKALYTAFNRPGDPVMLILDHPLNGTDGQVLAPAGSKVLGLVTKVHSYNRTGDSAELGLTFNGIITPEGQRIPVNATINNAEGLLRSGALQGVVFHPNHSVAALKREISTSEGGLYGTKIGKAYVLEEPLVNQVSDRPLDAMDINRSEIVIGIGDRLHLRSVEATGESNANTGENQSSPASTTPSGGTEQQEQQPQVRPAQ